MTALTLTEFDSRTALQEAAAEYVETQLRAALTDRGSATLFAAGGSTPGPAYERLSKAQLAWQNVTIGLTDERWVPTRHAASNLALLERTLWQGPAKAAKLLSMVSDASADPFEEAPTLDARHKEACKAPDIAIVGMGPDSHTLSWFPGARGLEAALDPDTSASLTAIEAIPSAVTGENVQRITLTLPVMARTRHVLLLITGEDKRSVFESAGPDTPIGRLVEATRPHLTVYWCP